MPGIDGLGAALEACVQYQHQNYSDYGGTLKIIACIEEPLVIKNVSTSLRGKGLCFDDACLPERREPPQDDLFSPHAGVKDNVPFSA